MVHWCIYSILHALSWDNESSFVFILTMQCIQREKKIRCQISECNSSLSSETKEQLN